MPQSGKKSSSPAAQYFGEVLRMLRTAAGLSQSELGERMSYSGAAVSAVETFAKPATDEFIKAAEKALEAGGIISAASKYLRLERYPAHFQGFVRVEQEALSVSSYCPQLIHGLLQTPDYARAVLHCAFPPLEDDVEVLVSARMERKALLDRKPTCVVNVILEEVALRRHIGGPEVMRAQYEFLVASAARPNVVLQVMPTERAEHAGLQGGPLTLLETVEETMLAYMEGNGHSVLVSDPREVGLLARRYAMIRSQALSPEESVALIEQLAGEL
ncbi:helix-turn-helix domain-containing protein [Streptomyces flavalbus]|uniref:Scr1 family TA system antitoxin-like transcriptional regulator n=1 Tax=Streptomyces flavalbus TaxID=2665155 RepID=A0ABW2W6Q5_9ACTN